MNQGDEANDLDQRLRTRLRRHPPGHRQWAGPHPHLAQRPHLHRPGHQHRGRLLLRPRQRHNYVRMFLYAGLVIIGAGIFDMVDGRVARQTNQVTVFGAFFDSVIDRYSDVVLFFGLLVFYARVNRFFYVVLVAFVMVTSLMVSYTRARAEALIGSCKVGFMERPERIVLIILGALFERWGVMAPVLWVLAVLSTITVIHRIQYTYTMAKGLALDAPATPAPASSVEPVPIRPTASPGPVSSTASVTADQREFISAPTAPRA